MSDTTDRIAMIDGHLDAHDAFDKGLTDIEPDGMPVALLVAALVCANSEPNPTAREALLIYVLDEAARRRHCLHMIRWINQLNLEFPASILDHLERFLDGCKLRAERAQLHQAGGHQAGA